MRLLMKASQFEHPQLKPSLISCAASLWSVLFPWLNSDLPYSMGKIMGLPSVESYVKVLDSKNKYSKLLKEVPRALSHALIASSHTM